VVEIRLDGAHPATKEPCCLCFREVLVVVEDDDGALAEREPTDSAPGFIEIRVLDKTRDNHRLAALNSKTAKVTAT
jgi:hypothetical protein